MNRRHLATSALGLATAAMILPSPRAAEAHTSGIVTSRSDFPMRETIERITKDVADKKIKLFDVIDQAKLAKDAGIAINPSTLIVFGNPPLGTQFLSASALSRLDWPVRLLVFEDDKGQVWTAYTDFDWIARRHGITTRKAQFKMASEVIGSIVSSTRA